MVVPVIDVFAGPGGLGEGFASFSQREMDFSNNQRATNLLIAQPSSWF